MTAKKFVRWSMRGRGDRVGSIDGVDLITIVALPHARRLEIRFAGEVKDREFANIDRAKKFAEEQAPAWLANHKAKLEDEARRKEEEKIEHLAMTAKLQAVVTRLADHGIPCRAMGGVFLRLDVAEVLVSKLEDLRRIEERGAV